MTSSEPASGRKRKKQTDEPPSLGRPEDDLLTTAQVAQLLHVGPPTVHKLVREGRLRAHRLPGTRQYLYWRRDIVQLIEDSLVAPADVDEERAETKVTGGE